MTPTQPAEPSANSDRQSPRSVLSRPDILAAIEAQEVFYEEGAPGHVQSTSIDLTLGPWYWEETLLEGERRIFNPNSRDDVNRVWGRLCYAPRHWWWIRQWGLQCTLTGFDPNDRMFFIPPGRQILCHTREFVGGLSRDIVQMMKARSGAGRSFLEVCRCAGWGDIGYHNRWTMEVNNSSSTHAIPLKVGQRYAQLVLFRTTSPLAPEDPEYSRYGKYQVGAGADVRCRWSPEIIRPAMYRDAEVPRPEEQRLYYRCTNPECGRHGAEEPRHVPAACVCGARTRVYELPLAGETVFPLYDLCVECSHTYHCWQPKSLAETRELRQREEAARKRPLSCVRCSVGYRHFLGGEYEVILPSLPDELPK